MDRSRPSIPSSAFRLWSASERTSADIDQPPAELATADKLVAVERQGRFGQIEPCRTISPMEIRSPPTTGTKRKSATAARSPADIITFDSAKRLDDLDLVASGNGRPVEWRVIENEADQLRRISICR
jgi:hypothetical protein